MGAGDLDSGARFGLVPIGLPTTGLDASRQDTERRAFPSLATKNSVFAWLQDVPTIVSETAVNGVKFNTINLRQNTSTGGASVDVPTWAAGAVIKFTFSVVTLGTSTAFTFTVSGPIAGSSLYAITLGAVSLAPNIIQVIIPFYDEPQVGVTAGNAVGTGTHTYSAQVVGFVRDA